MDEPENIYFILWLVFCISRTYQGINKQERKKIILLINICDFFFIFFFISIKHFIFAFVRINSCLLYVNLISRNVNLQNYTSDLVIPE